MVYDSLNKVDIMDRRWNFHMERSRNNSWQCNDDTCTVWLEKIRGVIKKDNLESYEYCKNTVKIGDIVRLEGKLNGESFREQEDNNIKEIEMIQIQHRKESQLTPVELGLLSDSAFSGVKSRQYYHTLMLNVLIKEEKIKDSRAVFNSLRVETVPTIFFCDTLRHL